MPSQKRKGTKKQEKEKYSDPYITKRYAILALIYAIENKEYSNVVSVLSEWFKTTKHNIYTDIGRLIKEGRAKKSEKDGITELVLTEKTAEEIINRACLPLDNRSKEIMHKFYQNKTFQDEKVLFFFKDMIPRVTEYLVEFLKNKIPEALIPKELKDALVEELTKFYNNEWVKSQLF